ncbi:hypothetical protein [Clostridium sp.]|uniref:hypothetical protein n=1 Tax=Clostridium sp. TaxID=1506 RepID=UPI002A9090C0|nr:hypothetical protein [Clostridium sp.]MDY6012249.1 hypothetical protein [Clostridium sp.]
MSRRRGKGGLFGCFPWLQNIRNFACIRWFTPAKCCVCLAMFFTLLFLGVGFTGIVIMTLLVIIFILVC